MGRGGAGRAPPPRPPFSRGCVSRRPLPLPRRPSLGPGWGGVGAGPSLINQRLVLDAGGGDATQGGKRGAQKGRGPEALSLPPLTQLIGLGASA